MPPDGFESITVSNKLADSLEDIADDVGARSKHEAMEWLVSTYHADWKDDDEHPETVKEWVQAMEEADEGDLLVFDEAGFGSDSAKTARYADIEAIFVNSRKTNFDHLKDND